MPPPQIGGILKSSSRAQSTLQLQSQSPEEPKGVDEKATMRIMQFIASGGGGTIAPAESANQTGVMPQLQAMQHFKSLIEAKMQEMETNMLDQQEQVKRDRVVAELAAAADKKAKRPRIKPTQLSTSPAAKATPVLLPSNLPSSSSSSLPAYTGYQEQSFAPLGAEMSLQFHMSQLAKSTAVSSSNPGIVPPPVPSAVQMLPEQEDTMVSNDSNFSHANNTTDSTLIETEQGRLREDKAWSNTMEASPDNRSRSKSRTRNSNISSEHESSIASLN